MAELSLSVIALVILWGLWKGLNFIKDESDGTDMVPLVVGLIRPFVCLIAIYFLIRFTRWAWENPIPFLDRF
jgi:hypothetical protein